MNPEQKRAIERGRDPRIVLDPEQLKKFVAEQFQKQQRKEKFMGGPHVFRDKDENRKYKYAVGDWIHSNDLNDTNTFWKITGQRTLNGELAYEVSLFLTDKMTESGFRHYGDMSGIYETDIRPLTDVRDTLWCLASDIKANEYKLLQEVKKLREDFDALMRTRELL
jgi:hypothetical protein